MTDGSKLIVANSGEPITLKQVKDFLDTLSEEELQSPALLWKIKNKNATIRAYKIREIHQMTEDHINPSGDGIEPISTYEPGEMDNDRWW